ncbi:hypothetical protein Gotri_027256 [Gossypium trilobum]|uniref:Pollen Ole e 1 allergen and extensin family protein n=1 Tax=Gossypium trilobum TaxID=34281 RepID=A0A7J9FRK7_9ROSI|nr:hypothetical protein [Gossypium trilobum]
MRFDNPRQCNIVQIKLTRKWKTFIIALLFVAFCVSTFFNFANAFGMPFIIIGHVYCDTCRVEFETTLSQGIGGAVVKLECRNRIDKSYTYRSKDIVTDKKGNYEIEDCIDPTGKWRKTRVVLTTSGGIKGNVRVAKSLGFRKRTPLPSCNKILKEMRLF